MGGFFVPLGVIVATALAVSPSLGASPGAFQSVDTVLTVTGARTATRACTSVRRRDGTPAYELCLETTPDAYTGFVHGADLTLTHVPPRRDENLLWWPGPYHGLRAWDFLADDAYRNWRTTPTRELGTVRFRVVRARLAATPRSSDPFERGQPYVFKKLSVRVVVDPP